MIDYNLQNYIETYILPQYAGFDKAHNIEHIHSVIKESLNLARNQKVDENKVYAIAAYHDLGMPRGRKLHHIYSAELLKADQHLRQWFNADDIKEMSEAVEDHRASSDHIPRSIYGKIIAEADRDISPEKILRRTIQFGLKNSPAFDKKAQIERAISHLHEKYAEGGYLKLYLHSKKNEEGLNALRQIIKNEPDLIKRLTQFYDKEIKSN